MRGALKDVIFRVGLAPIERGGHNLIFRGCHEFLIPPRSITYI